MKRPIVIVDPLSSGIELAPLFVKRGVPVIAVTFKPLERVGFGTKIQESDFCKIIPDGPDLIEDLRKYNPIAIIPGTESGVNLAQKLSDMLTPEYSNDSAKNLNRLHKAYMQEALEMAGVPTIKTLNTSSEQKVVNWIKKHKLSDTPLIIKPPVSAGSDKVFHIPASGDWKIAFNRVLNEPSKITGQVSQTAVVQEEAIGIEYALGTVSANGEHYLAHIIKYNKASSLERKTIFDHVEFISFDSKIMKDIFEYTKKALMPWG